MGNKSVLKIVSIRLSGRPVYGKLFVGELGVGSGLGFMVGLTFYG